MRPPRIDPRTLQDLVRQAEHLVQENSGGPRLGPSASEDPLASKDPLAYALIQLFAHMAEEVVQRINAAPDRHLLAFLDLIGGRLQPALPARVPVTFSLASGTVKPVVVPARTRGAAPPAGSGDPVVFETERELVLTPSRLVAAFVRGRPLSEAGSDAVETWYELIEKAGGAPRLEAVEEGENCIYLTCEKPLGENYAVRVAPVAPAGDFQAVDHFLWDGDRWQNQQVTPKPRSLRGLESVWWQLRPTREALAVADDLQVSIRVEEGVVRTERHPEAVFAEGIPLDPAKEFKPFGEVPAAGSSFYIRLPDPLAGGTKVQVRFKAGATPIEWKDVAWDALVGDGSWELLEIGTLPVPEEAGEAIEQVLTLTVKAATVAARVNGVQGHWLRARLIRFTHKPPSPPTMTATKTDDKTTTYHVELQPPPATSLELSNLRLSYTSSRAIPPKRVLSRHDWCFEDHTQEVEAGRSIKPFSRAAPAPQAAVDLGFSMPFSGDEVALYLEPVPAEGRGESAAQPPRVELLYSVDSGAADRGATPPGGMRRVLEVDDSTEGLTRPGIIRFPGPVDIVSSRKFDRELFWLHLYLTGEFEILGSGHADSSPTVKALDPVHGDLEVEVREFLQQGEIDELHRRLGDVAVTVVEGQAWVRWTEVADFDASGPGDRHFNLDRESGEVRFGDGSKGRRPPEGSDIRARHFFHYGKRPLRVKTNTTMAVQALTVENEILGSGTGEPNQAVHTAQGPVLEDPWIELREAGRLLPEEVDDLRRKEGKDRVTVVEDEVWVRWREVTDFHASGPGDRHFTLDHKRGEVRFGDGISGRKPPAGDASIRARRYRVGGGKAGNVEAGAVAQLTRALPSVASITNPAAASGGADAETHASLRRRAPTLLRHRYRAVTVQDFEDLAYEASAAVARARCFGAGDRTGANETDRVQPGCVMVFIVEKSDVPKPVPSPGLILRVEDYLGERAMPGVDLRVRAPDWVKIDAMTEIVRSDDASVGLEGTIRQALQTFLHPVNGGVDGQGLPFGRRPHASDLYSLLLGLDGVEDVPSLSLVGEEQVAPRALSHCGELTITFRPGAG